MQDPAWEFGQYFALLECEQSQRLLERVKTGKNNQRKYC